MTDDEWTQVKRTPTLGASIVETVSFFTDVREALLHIRARLDGHGYPDGFEAEEIRLLARFLAIAEDYAAMTSARPCCNSMPSSDALRQSWTERAKTFDPQIVEAFVMHRVPGETSALSACSTNHHPPESLRIATPGDDLWRLLVKALDCDAIDRRR